MEKIKINVHPTFLLFACLLIYFGQGFLFLNYLIVIFLHEFSHAYIAKTLGYSIRNIKLIPFGICLNIKSTKLLPKDEIKIAIAGPLMNLFLCLSMFALWWIFPSSYNYTYLFCYANFVTFIFNLLPAFPLDGGRILNAFIRLKSSQKNAIIGCKIVSIILCILLFGIFVISCFVNINLTYLFVIFCILSGVLDKNEKERYSFIRFSISNKIKKIVKIKNLYVNGEERLYKICKYIDNFSYINLYVYDCDGHLLTILSEKEFINLIEKHNSTDTFYSVLKYAKPTF